VVGKIESGNNYSIGRGGSGNHYDGRWQLGAAAKTDAAAYLGEADPGHGGAARDKFNGSPEMQERYFAAFTAKNFSYLKGMPEFDSLSTREKFQVLGYAHNQGAGGAAAWLKTGEVRRDGFGTAATKYSTALAEAYGKQTGGMMGKEQMVLTEPGELYFPPGTYGPDIMQLNKDIPRFQTGGTVGMTGTDDTFQFVDNMEKAQLQEKMDMYKRLSDPIQLSSIGPMATPSDVMSPVQTTSPPPLLPNDSNNSFAMQLVMTKNLLSASIGG